jgi:hypothetical protein
MRSTGAGPILDGECDDLPVNAFCFEGSLAEIRASANGR